MPDDLIRSALDLELADGTVVSDAVADTPCVFLGSLYRAERTIAERLLHIQVGKRPRPDIDVEKALSWAERKTDLSLAPAQANAVRLALTSTARIVDLVRTRIPKRFGFDPVRDIQKLNEWLGGGAVNDSRSAAMQYSASQPCRPSTDCQARPRFAHARV